MAGRGRGQGQGQGPPQASAPASKKYVPGGYYDSGSDTDDDMNYYSQRIDKPTIPSKPPSNPILTSASSSSNGKSEIKSSTSTSASTVDEDDWSLPSSSPVVEIYAAETVTPLSPPPTLSDTTKFKPPGIMKRESRSRESLPLIPDINRGRSAIASRSINAVWNNGECGKEKDIYTSGIAKTLRTEFKDAKNPYATALNLMIYSVDFMKAKFSGRILASEVMKEFKKWLLDMNSMSSFERQFLNPNLQNIAFSLIMKQPNVSVVKLVCELYRLKDINSTLIGPINELCAATNYKAACWAATYLGLYREFDIHKFVIPLFLQSKEDIAFEYLAPNTDNQTLLIKFFDDILGATQPVVAMRSYVFTNQIDNVQFGKLEIKSISKMLDRLRNKFGLGTLSCPNSGKRKRTAALRHLMYRKYVLMDETMSEAGFKSLVDDTVENNDELIEETLSQFRSYCDHSSAAKFALRHAIPLHKITYEVQVLMHEICPTILIAPNNATVQQWDEDWDLEETVHSKTEKSSNGGISTRAERSLTPSLQSVSKPGIFSAQSVQAVKPVSTQNQVPPQISVQVLSPNGAECSTKMTNNSISDSDAIFYKCPISHSNVHLLDTPELLNIFFQDLEEAQRSLEDGTFPVVVVGFDSEWKPILATSGVSLIQVALSQKIYLIDIHKLKGSQGQGSANFWQSLLDKFFKNEKILKLGVGLMKNDVVMLQKTTPVWANMMTDFKGGLDLSLLALDLGRTCREIFQNYEIGAASYVISLSDLVLAFTEKRLHKEEQFSNWESRPLREAQLRYAAADAYALLDIYWAMKNRAERLGIPFEMTVVRLLQNWQVQANATLKKHPARISARELLESGSRGSVDVPRYSPFQTQRAADEVRLVCDSMLGGLGRLLRSCGVDTVNLSTDDAHLRCVDIAVRDDRYIVTTKTCHKSLAPFVPTGHCFLLEVVNQTVEALRLVLAYFNIVVTNLNLYTRCQICNDNTFVKIRSELLKEMYTQKFPSEVMTNRPNFDKVSGRMEIEEDIIASTSGVGMANDEKTQRRWILLPENSLVTEGPSDVLRTKKGALVGVKGISCGVLDKVEHIYACNHCGKCYWPKPTVKAIES